MPLRHLLRHSEHPVSGPQGSSAIQASHRIHVSDWVPASYPRWETLSEYSLFLLSWSVNVEIESLDRINEEAEMLSGNS